MKKTEFPSSPASSISSFHADAAECMNRPACLSTLPACSGPISKATETTSRDFNTVPPYDKLEILAIHHHNYKNTLKNTSIRN
ncbi:hypothetical protein E2C01_043410 [Portunus trituberculatus]|uniref:Uncharacterized protein n=1 Tax=Portunus trituberculatus TaxID=210409 RepID=A0A5B7FSW3_PORTR|nr:hypothetical protein [Portunus trituberculatus]